jgi:hypothetical protein
VDLYDDQEAAGGFIRSQVPSFRLPMEVLEEEVNYILDMGVTTHFSTYIESMKDFLKKDYDAVFVGTGAPRGRDLMLPGREEGAAFIHVGINWLAGVQYRHVGKTGTKTLVIGGGNTAMDCCRTARRLGGDEVSVIIRGSQDNMKASPWEIEDALHEDIPIREYLSPLEYVVGKGILKGMLFEHAPAALKKARNRNSSPAMRYFWQLVRKTPFPGSRKMLALILMRKDVRRLIRSPFNRVSARSFLAGMPPSAHKTSLPPWLTVMKRRSPSIFSLRTRMFTKDSHPTLIWLDKNLAIMTGCTTVK